LPQVTYTRGNDLSGSLQGAGGIGGLLARTQNPSTINPELSAFATAYYHADGNGNVTCLIYTSQMIAAKYLYDPYGNTLAQYGLLADANTYRFSSKEWNAQLGLYYYVYRFFDPNLQRWLNRDPIGELGGLNLYMYVLNNPVDDTDLFGLYTDLKDCELAAYSQYLRDINSDIHLVVANHYLEETLLGVATVGGLAVAVVTRTPIAIGAEVIILGIDVTGLISGTVELHTLENLTKGDYAKALRKCAECFYSADAFSNVADFFNKTTSFNPPATPPQKHWGPEPE
jgi:RHS repeat-associated protein